MSWIVTPPLDFVYRRRENDDEPVGDRRLRSRVRAGEIVRIAPGAYVTRDRWQALSPLAQHAQRVWEAGARLSPGRVFSHHAAAALHGIDILGPWPSAIDVSIATASGGRSTGGIRRHPRELARIAAIPWGTQSVTTPLQTVLDLLGRLRFLEAVVAADRALWTKRSGGPLIAQDHLIAAAHEVRHATRAVRAAEFSTPLADSVRETHSRVLIRALGFPAPELQTRFILSDGSAAYTDFFWPRYRHIGEFDGVGKYRDPLLLRGRTPEQALIAEKDREDDLRRQVDAFSRWRTPALESPSTLYDILRSAGLPSDRARPGR